LEKLTRRVMAGLSKTPADKRFVVGIVGFPGAGKSTLAEELVNSLNAVLPAEQKAQVLPMDGYHLRNETLDKMGLRALKGIPDTFDAAGFIQLLTKIRQSLLQILKAPVFDRSIDGSVEDAVEIGMDVKVVVTEGNYLLHEDGEWVQIAELLDDSWFLDTSIETIRPRLIARHVAGGRSLDAAIAKVESTDLPNALIISKSRPRARALVTASVRSDRSAGFQYEISDQ
jgi:pantothenate kinase